MLPEEWDAVAVFGEIDRIPDLHSVTGDARRESAPAVKRDNDQLIRRVGDELLRRGVDQRFGIDNA